MLLDLTHTSHTRARTGIQRVARSLWRELGARAQAVCHDPHLGSWRRLEAWEEGNLRADEPSGGRGARWPVGARLRGRLRRLIAPGVPPPDGGAGVLFPEVFSPGVAAARPALFARVEGPRAAVFHDAIALRAPEWAPAKSVGRFPSYLKELLAFDAVAAVSEDSRASLVEYWRIIGAGRTPPVEVIPLGVDRPAVPAPAAGRPGRPPTVLCVSSVEARKNHAALLEACESLWAEGRRFELRLIGIGRPETAAAALARIAALKAAGRPLRYDGPTADSELSSAYAESAFTVYPSLLEGFGLPVLESLAQGRPCVCSASGALGESARGGGCLAVDPVDAAGLRGALARMLDDPALRERLAAEARARLVATWADYARNLSDWMAALPRRS